MIRLLASFLVGLIANAVGLLVAASVLDGFTVDSLSFITAVLIFSLSTVILGPLIVKIALTNAPYLMGGIALVTSFVGLFITNLISDGITITGLRVWIFAPLIIWVFSLVSNLLLPLIIFKKTLQAHKEKQAQQ